MARKLTKFALGPETGTLVYRDNGKAVRGDYEIRDNRVYRNGRLAGYIGKGTAGQQKRIAAMDHRNRTDRRRAVKRRETWNRIRNAQIRFEALGATQYERDSGGNVVSTHIYSRREISEINFAHLLNRAVSEGKMSRAEATERYDKYINTEESMDRSQQWDDLKGRFEELGFQYP